MALVVAHVTREQVFSFWPIKQPNTSRPDNRVGQQSTRAARGLPSRSVACSLHETRDCHRRPSHTLHRPLPSPVTPSSPPLRAPVPWPRPLRSALCSGAGVAPSSARCGSVGRPPAARCDAAGCPAPSLHASRATEQTSLSKFPVSIFPAPSPVGRSPARPSWNSGTRRVKGFLLFISILC